MENSKSFLQKQDIKPRISFKDGKTHIVKLLNDKQDTLTDENGKQVEGVKYLVEEEGEMKTFFTSSIGLITKLAELEPETIVAITMKRKKGEKGYTSYYDVEEAKQEFSDNEIPVIENESEPTIPQQGYSSTNSPVDSQEQF